MSNNKRPPKEIQNYVVVMTEDLGGGVRESYHYFRTQKEAKQTMKGKPGVKKLFKISYDYFGVI